MREANTTGWRTNWATFCSPSSNLARHLGVDPEAALRRTNAKFERRFRFVEDRLSKEERTTAEASLEEMDRFWNEAKADKEAQ